MFSYIICTLFSEKNWKKTKGKYFKIDIYPKKEGAMVFIGLCAKRSETAAYSPSMLALVRSSPADSCLWYLVADKLDRSGQKVWLFFSSR